MSPVQLSYSVITLLVLLLVSNSSAAELAPYAPSRDEAVLRGEIKETLATYEKRAQEAEKEGTTSLFPLRFWDAAAQNYLAAASVAGLSGQLQKAINYAEKGREMAAKAKSPILQVRAVTQLRYAYTAVRDFDKVRQVIAEGFQIVKEIPSNTVQRIAQEGALYSALSDDFLRRGEYDKAIDALSKALELREAALVLLSQSRTRNQISLDTFRTHVTNNLTRLGNAYREAGKNSEALEHYERALRAANEWKIPSALGDLYENVGEVYVRQDNFPQALDSFNKALALAQRQQALAAISSASLRIGDVYRRTGKPDEAMQYFQNAVRQIESARSVLRSEVYRQSYFEGGLDAYVSLIGVFFESGKPEEAFSYAEHARSRSFLDLLGSKAQLSRIRSGLMEEEKALQERITGIKTFIGEDTGDTNKAVQAKELTEAEKTYNDLLIKVRKQDKEQATLMAVEPLALKQVQELLDPNQTILEYFITKAEVFIWVVEKDKLASRRVALSKAELTKQVKSLRGLIANLGDQKQLNGVSGSLYHQLIEPVASQITGKELIIVPHDVLHYLPFQALVSYDGRYLIEKYPVDYLTSASLLQFTKEKRRAMGDKVLALGNPDLGDPKMSLEYAEAEGKEIKSLYPEATVLLEKDATEEKAKALSPQSDILHFASHAELNENDPLSSAILLAKSGKEDGRLEVREIFGMDLHASLVVLSACETGLGKLSSGDELVGLTRAFIYAGTPSVVASLWSVDDSSTALLMASFYKNLKTMSKVEALRQAQLTLIRGEARSDLLARRGIGGVGRLGESPASELSDSGSALPAPSSLSVSTSHPYFWAPFILVGDGK